MPDLQISDEEIKRLLAEPAVEFEPNETDHLLANPPIIAERFRFAGDMRLSKALAHPILGQACKDFHDRLFWSRYEPELGAEGIEVFLSRRVYRAR